MARKRLSREDRYLIRVLGLFGEFRWRILMIIGIGIVGIVMFSFTPTFTRNIFNNLEESFDLNISPTMRFIYTQLVIFTVLALLNEVFQIICSFAIIRYENRAKHELVVKIKRKLDVVPVSFLDQFATGDLTRRVANLTGMLTRTVLMIIYRAARTVFFYITTAIAMFQISWILALVVIASLPLCIITAKLVSSRTQRYFNNNNQVIINSFSYMDKKVSLHNFYRTHGIDGAELEYEAHNENETRANIAEEVALGFNTIYITFIQNFMFLLVTVVFGILFVNGTLPEFGALPAFIVFSNRFLANAVIVTETTNLLQSLGPRAKKVFEILDYPDTMTEREHIDIERIGEIAFRNVSIERGGEKLLSNVSFRIPPGSSVAIVGAAGSGKGKIVEVLAKLEQYTGGQVAIDGVNLDEIKSDSYYPNFGIAFGLPFIFRGTVAENLLYGIRRTLPENVMQVTRRLGSHDFIAQLPNGYNTELSSDTTKLSVSQKQALNVARMVLKNPDLFVFNQALSSSDPVTEKDVIESIRKMNPRQTKIFVTHRLSSIENCDMIIFMAGGRAVEMGTHAELMKRKKRYYSAYTSG
ncbi:MAG: ABC transporter ATP-binding protein/permease [Firmicutes bacterium]|nr:ABC transporter ATP-binding protein/permease [Bacillota bacterium]